MGLESILVMGWNPCPLTPDQEIVVSGLRRFYGLDVLLFHTERQRGVSLAREAYFSARVSALLYGSIVLWVSCSIFPKGRTAQTISNPW